MASIMTPTSPTKNRRLTGAAPETCSPRSIIRSLAVSIVSTQATVSTQDEGAHDNSRSSGQRRGSRRARAREHSRIAGRHEHPGPAPPTFARGLRIPGSGRPPFSRRRKRAGWQVPAFLVLVSLGLKGRRQAPGQWPSYCEAEAPWIVSIEAIGGSPFSKPLFGGARVTGLFEAPARGP